MQRLVSSLQSFGCSVVALFLVDATFVADAGKFISGSLMSLSCMLKLELPHVNVLTKCDLLPEGEVDKILDMKSASSVEVRKSGRVRTAARSEATKAPANDAPFSARQISPPGSLRSPTD